MGLGAPWLQPGFGAPGFGPGPRPAHGFARRFMTRTERIAQLEAYLTDLENEATAVRERIERIKAEGAAAGNAAE